jgi:hypothetical protein
MLVTCHWRGYERNAFERKEEYGRDGKCIKREWAVGPIVPWAIVALTALALGKGLFNLPPVFWESFK